ncbi:MAG: hypothetical protein EBV07_00205 [Proteobacteria bacterium]|nr:hypothetical protein [Pseudomonadota bacterium]
MRNKFFYFFVLFFCFSLSIEVHAVEPLIKYNTQFQKDASGNRKPDGDTWSTRYRNGATSLLDPNSIMIGDKDDCFPDDTKNPKGNILISGFLTAKETNKPINGAVVAVYMGSEHVDNFASNLGDSSRFVVGDGERLSNLYYYDVSKDGQFTVYACNDYKQLSQDKISRYGNNFCPDGYVKTGTKCTHFDYVKAYPKFYIAVICGMSGFELNRRTNDLDRYRQEMENAKLKPLIGEVLSIDNYNEPYKGVNPPSFLSKRNLDIKVNCGTDIEPFPVPMFLDYSSDGNISTCRMDDVSPNLINYFKKVQTPLRSSLYDLNQSLVQGSSKIPNIDTLRQCVDPSDPLCAKNFITKSFPIPDKQSNLYNYGNKSYIEGSTSSVNANPVLRQEILAYDTSRGLNGRKIDFENGNSPDGRDYLPKNRNSYEGQIDGKLDAKTSIDDVKFDLESLKDLYACFTSFNFPINRSSSDFDEQNFNKVNPTTNSYFTPNIRVPSCRELYCGSEYIPSNKVCKVKITDERNGVDVERKKDSKFVQINALSGYGPGVTMTLRSKKDITLDLMKLVNELISSDFNPKKDLPNVKYKPVSSVTDIIACYADNGSPVLLNRDGSITYQSNEGPKNFFSPVPAISFLSIPYNIEFLHAITNDNYANKTSSNSFYAEECNYGDSNSANVKDKQFANCRSAVIPGGVYSVSALRVIAKMCTDNTKLPTSNQGVFNYKAESTRTDETLVSVNPGEMAVQLAITKIGTPLSLCLCDPNSPTAGCNTNTRLNNKATTNFGTASFVGDNSQNKGKNYLGTLCNMTKEDAKSTSCSDFLGGSGFNLEGSSNFLGSNNNIRVAWTYSNQDKDANFQTELFFHHDTDTGPNTPQTNQDQLPSLNKPISFISVVNGNKSQGFDSQKACVSIYQRGDDVPSDKRIGDCKEYAYFKQNIDDKNISSKEKPYDIPEPNTTETPKIKLNEIEFNSATNSYRLKDLGDASLYQKTKDGTSGYIYTKYQYLNQKYDPIPDLLNDFRKYTSMGIIPVGGKHICKTPKLATLIDFKTTEYTTNSRDSRGGANEDGLTLNFSSSRGAFCNELIPEELDRCENGQDIIPNVDTEIKHPGFSPSDECKLRKCLSVCNQLYQTYEFYSARSDYLSTLIESATSPALTIDAPTDPATGKPVNLYLNNKKVSERVYFCKNSDPKDKNVAFEMNKGDEGCVIDYVRNIREIYTLPKQMKSDMPSNMGNPLYAKFNYPVYNNQICINPVNQLNFSGRGKSDAVNDSMNCKPFIGPQRPQDFR